MFKCTSIIIEKIMPYNVKDFSGFVVVKIALHIIVHFGDKKQRIFIVTDPHANSLSKTR